MTRRYAKQRPSQSPWFGLIPEAWTIGQIRGIGAAWTSNVDKHSVEGQYPIRLCNYTDVYKNHSIVAGMEFMPTTATSEQIARFRIRVGDTIITKDSETADDIGIPAFVEYAAEDLVCGYHLAIVRPSPDRIDSRFLYWVMNSQPVLRQWSVLAAGVTRVGIRSGDLCRASIPLPTRPEQRVIADYLDRETARIDALTLKQQQLISVLRERRSAVISRRVDTPGETLPFRRFLVSIRQGWSPNCEADAADGVSEWGVLKTGAPNGGTFRPHENKRLPLTEVPRPEHVVRVGEIVMSRASSREWVGSAAVVKAEYPCLLLSDLTYGLGVTDDLDVDYAVYALGSRRARGLLEAMAKGTSPSMQKLSQRDVRELPLRVPSLDQQRRIVNELDSQTAKIDALIEKVERFIELAQERRAALITAAVTGQIDVRDHAKADAQAEHAASELEELKAELA